MRAINKAPTGKSGGLKSRPAYGPPIFQMGTSAFQEKDDRELLKAVNGTAQSARKSWLSLITLMAYLLVAVTSVTHSDLLLNTPLKLPILQIEVGLRGFFIVAPALFILVHFGVLLHHAMLTRKAAALHSLLEKEEGTGQRTHPLRLEVSSYFFAQSLVGPERGNLLHFLLRSMSFLSLGLLPLCLLLSFQVAFLPAHDESITILHRIYILMAACILTLIGGGRHLPTRAGFWRGVLDIARTYLRNARAGLVAALLILFSSFAVATLPSRQDDSYAFLDMDRLFTRLAPVKVPFNWNDQKCYKWRGDRCAFWLTGAIFEQPIDYVSGQAGIFSRNLVVTDNQSLLRKHQLGEGESGLSLRGRDLRYGTFDRSDLQRADFIAADLSGASFRGADLRNVTFDCANRGTTQDCTKLTKSILTGAKLTGVTINHAEISGIVLRQTDLRGFDFASVNLSNADLSETKLRGTNFSFANLIGANLSSTDAEGARFYHTLMLASDLSGAKLDGANLNGADLSGALMGGVSLFATNLMDARLFGAFLREAHVWQTFPAAAKAYALADLTKIQIQRPSEEDIPRLQEAAEFLKALPDDPYSWGPKRPSLADMTAWEGWAASDEKAVWQSLVNGNRQPGADSVGRYLGDLACLSDGVFLGILATRSEIYGTYFDLGGSYPDPIGVLPPGVSDSDVRQSGDLGFISTSSRVVPPRFPEQPELATAFYQRIKEPNCMATKRLSSETLENLRREIDAAKRRASSRASPANIQIPTIAR